MAFVFNPLTGLFDITGAGAGATGWVGPTSTEATLSVSGNTDGDAKVTLDTDYIWVWDNTTSRWINTGVKAANAGSTPNSQGYSLSYSNVSTNRRELQLVLQPADATNPGIISTTTQTIAGTKTFSGRVNVDSSLDISSAGTLNIGTNTATTINIGKSGSTINIIGSTIYEQVTNLQVSDKLITLNKDGGATTAFGSGIELEENAVITGYVKTSVDRNSWLLKAPNTAGDVTLTPGAGGITLSQSSHDPVTLAAVGSSPNANGASLSSQQLTLQPADGTNPGLVTTGSQTFGGTKTFANIIDSGLTADTVPYANSSKQLTSSAVTPTELGYVSGVTSAIQTQLNGKQASGNYITALTGDATASGPGSVALTLATVNSNVGTFASVTVNGKGLVTAAAALSGDATTSGSALTLATVNGNVGSFGSSTAIPSFTVNAKGLITAASTNVVIAPAGTLTGTTLAANVVTSSLTSLGTIGTGVWQGTVIGALYGGTGGNSSASTGIAQVAAGTWSYSTALANGTTATTQSANDNSTKVATTAYIDGSYSPKSAGDITETSFTAANNQSAAANVTGLAFANATVRSFRTLLSIVRNTTYSVYELNGIQKGASWEMEQAYVGDDTGLVFTITTAGQVQYTSTNTGNTATVKFRAITTTV